MGLTRIERAEFETPWGGGWVWVCDSHPVAIYLPHSEHEDSVSVSEQIASDLEISCGAKGVPVGECAEQWASRLGTFLLTGVPQWDRGDVNLAAIDADGFRGRVYERLMEVPAGETVGYGELAARAGSPRAARAAGTAVAENPLSLVIPCHRVVRADGSIGKFGSGTPWKKFPLDQGGGLREGIQREKELLAGLRARADLVVDTTRLNIHQLRRRLQGTVLSGELVESIYITFLSFGYKYGVPTEADMVLDARFLPNPHWVEELRSMSGRDSRVKDYVLGYSEAHGFIERVADLLRFLVPPYLKEQKIQLVVAVGCTGGRHRSV